MFQDKTLVGLLLAVFLMMIGVGMIVALLPQKMADLDGHSRSVGYLASAFALSYILLQVPIGNLSDKIGFKPFLVGGYLFCFATGLLFYFAMSTNMVLLARLLQGVGEAPVWALAPALLSIKFPLTKGKVMGIYNAVIHLGLTIGPILGVFLAKFWKNDEAFLFYAFACLAGAATIYFFVENTRQHENQVSMDFKNIMILVKNQRMLITLMGITLYGAGYGIFLTTIPAFLMQDRSFSPVYIGIFFSLFYVAISLSQVITGPLSDKLGRNVFMIIGLFTAAVGICLVTVTDFPWILWVLTLASLGLGVFYIASMAFLNEIVPATLKGTISGAYYLFWGIGMFFGPPIMSQMTELIGFNGAMTYYSLAIILIVVTMTKIVGVGR